MASVIQSVRKGSPAWKKVLPGESLLAVNGNPVRDVLDYQYFTYDARLMLELSGLDGKTRRVRIRKDEGENLGLDFETYLMDNPRSCANRCIFCFVDQLPPGMRETLYFKDDDARLSFLMGNYITLTNLSDREAQRIIDLKISPINVSVHTTNPELRCRMLGNRNGGKGLMLMRRFAEAGITMNCQIVCCPGINDGAELERSMRDLAEMYPGVNSVSVVPVGLTKYREGLSKIMPYCRETAEETVDQVEAFAEKCLVQYGTRIFFCADELYLKAGRDVRDDEYYEDYTQLENGVGMLRLLETEFFAALPEKPRAEGGRFSIATGVSAAPYLQKLVGAAASRCPELNGTVYPVENDFFGHSINVAGLLTGKDIIAQLCGKDLGTRLLIPQTMLRHGEGVFLDDVTLSKMERELGVPIQPVEVDGAKLVEAFFASSSSR